MDQDEWLNSLAASMPEDVAATSMPSQSDPMVGQNGSPLGLLSLGLRAMSPNNVSSFMRDQVNPAVQQGLGLAQSGLQNAGSAIGRGVDAITPSSDTMSRIFAGLEAAGAVGRGATPLYLQQQHLDLQKQQLLGSALDRREAMAQRIQQAEEQKRQHNWGIAEKLMTTGNMGALEEFAKTQFPDAMPIVQGVSKQHLSSIPILANQGYLPQDFIQRVMNPKPGAQPVTPAEVSMHVKMGMDNWQADMKEEAKTKLLTDAINTPPMQRRPHQQLLVEEHQKKLEVQNADIELKKAQAAKATKYADEGPPDHSTINQLSKSIHGQPFDNTTQAQQQQTMAKYAAMRPEAQQQVTSAIPVGQTGKAQEFRDPVTGQAAPSWATPQQLADLGFVNIEPSQIAAVNGIRNVDAAMKEIVSAGSSLLRKESGTGNWAEIPRGILQMPIVNLIRKYSGNPDAAVLDSAIKRISPTLAKLSGDTGNIALAEQQLYASSIFSDSDTLESLHRKVQSIQEAQSRTRAALGFVPDEKAYMRRLIIQGKTDEQIKATMAERNRYR
jgi:hypothetical protein